MGWDWGPNLPDMGIWRPVYIVAFDKARLADVEVRQSHRKNRVDLSLSATADGDAEGTTARFSLLDPTGKTVSEVMANEDGDAILFVDDPQLWWPNGYGKQPLYTLVTTLMDGEQEIDRREMRIGLRTLTLSTAKDRWGREFCFVINRKKIFSMGANYVPEDNILSRLSKERTEKLLRQCIKANFNTVRVWGGGFYPFDWFYDLCDELGLLVWQDFMIACMDVRMLPSFEENVRVEAEQNLCRIRHHACLGILCGNNEMELFTKGKTDERVRADYLYLYERVLPDIAKRLAPDIFYWPSSPSSGGGFRDPGGSDEGDAHYWSVWHSRKPMTDYRKQTFRFCSEFGFESMPNKETVEAFSLPSDRNLFSPVMNHHQKCKGANGTIMYYLSEYYLYPESFDAVIYASQVMQADAITYAVEHFRRIRGRCMGTTYWQLNDCWPVASWSSVDGAGREKALHHAARRFFAPVLLSAEEEGTAVSFHVTNEKLIPFKGKIELRLCTREGEILSDECLDVCVDALSSASVLARDYADAVRGKEQSTYLTYTLMDAEGAVISRSTLLFVRPKQFAYRKPQITARITETCGVKRLHLCADTLVQKVRVTLGDPSVEPEEQYFDLWGGEEYAVEINPTERTAEELLDGISFFSVADIAPSCLGSN